MIVVVSAFDSVSHAFDLLNYDSHQTGKMLILPIHS